METNSTQGKRSLKEEEEEEEELVQGGEEEDYDEEESVNGLEYEQDERKKKMVNSKKGSGAGGSTMVYCRAENCPANMSIAKRYHQRHRVCEFHAKAAVVAVDGRHQRFCQQCSRFHELSEFDESKRSCRRRLAGHNQRRRKISSDGSS